MAGSASRSLIHNFILAEVRPRLNDPKIRIECSNPDIELAVTGNDELEARVANGPSMSTIEG
jgi:hypothetical protein